MTFPIGGAATRHSVCAILAALLLLASCSGDPNADDPPLTRPPERPAEAMRGDCPRAASLDLELPVWDLYLSQRDWSLLHEDVTASVKVAALLCVQGRAYPLGLELQGASTRKLPKKSFDLKFSAAKPLEEAPFGVSEALPRILLKAMANDQALIREALGFEAWRGIGHLAPRVGFANLRINGRYWGLYNLLEPIDLAFLERHGFAPGGHLYKAVRTKEGRADFKPGRDLHTGFEDKSNPASDDWADLAELAKRLQKTPARHDAFMREINSVFPLAQYIDRMIWIAVTQNTDAVAQNFYLYNWPVDGRDAWTMLPWDSNIAFGAHWAKPFEVVGTDESAMVDGGSYFGGRLLQVAELRAEYIARFDALLDGALHSERLLEHAVELAEHVRHDLGADQARWKRQIDPDAAFAAIESFVRERPRVMREALDALEQAHATDAGAPTDAGAARDAGAEEDGDIDAAD